MIVRDREPAGLVPDHSGASAHDRGPRQGGERRHAVGPRRARRWASSAKAARARPRWRWRIMRLIVLGRADRLSGAGHPGPQVARAARRCGATCRSCSRTPTAASQPADDGRADRRRGARRARLEPGQDRQRDGGRDPGRGRPRPADDGPLSARILRRSAPAHRHRPGDDPAPEARGAGRADLGARHDRAGADRRAAARPCSASTGWPTSSSATTCGWSGRWRTRSS